MQKEIKHAKDYVKMMWLILQHDNPEDWVIATGKTTKIRDFVKMAFDYVGVELEFLGRGIDEIAVVKSLKMININLKLVKRFFLLIQIFQTN